MIGLALTSQGRMETSFLDTLRTNSDAPTLDAPVTHTPGIGDSPAEKIKGGSHPDRPHPVPAVRRTSLQAMLFTLTSQATGETKAHHKPSFTNCVDVY